MAQQNTGSAKRYGARYGRENRLKVAAAEKQYKQKTECPFCKMKAVKRKSAGIFECKKCVATFAAKAYSSEVA